MIRPVNTRRRLTALAAVALVSVAACGGSDDSSSDDDAAVTTDDVTETTEAVTETTEVVPETTEAVTQTTEVVPPTTEATSDTTEPSSDGTTPALDATPTPEGTQLAFGDTAVVALDDEAPDELIGITVQSLEPGTDEELAELAVQELEGGETLHYLTLDITNVSSDPTEDLMPSTGYQLLVVQDDGNFGVPVINFVDFAPCDEEDPDEVPLGESFTTCLTYLASPGATPTAVGFAQTFTSDPILWQ